MFKTIAIFFIIILDVVMFPFSCNEDKNKNECIFVVREDNEQLNIHINEREFYKIPKDMVLQIPERFIDFEKEGYKIIGWMLYKHGEETLKEVAFPYTIQEGDYIGYFEGHRSCVVFEAKLEYVGSV